jgi:hypothetical protein
MPLLKQTFKLLYASLFSQCSCSDSNSQIWFDKTAQPSTARPSEPTLISEMFPEAIVDETRTVTVDYVRPRLKARLNSINARGIDTLSDFSLHRRHSENISNQLFPEESVNLLEGFDRWKLDSDFPSSETSPSLLLAILNFNFRLNK